MSVPFEIPDWLIPADDPPPDTSSVDPHRVEDLVNRFIAAKQDALFLAPDAYNCSTGADAVDGAPAILDRLAGLKQATLATANDDGTRAVVDPRLDAHLDDASDGIDRHVTEQRDALIRQIISERQRLVQRAAQLEHNNDDKLAGLAEAHAGAAQGLARMNGEPEASAMEAARSAIWRTAIDQRLANGNGPQALALFDHVKDQLAPDDHLSVEVPLQVARDDQATNQWIASQIDTDGPPLQDRVAGDPDLSPGAKLIVRAKLDAQDSAAESKRVATARGLDDQMVDTIRTLATAPNAYKTGTLAQLARAYDDVDESGKAASTRRLATQEAVLLPFAQMDVDKQQRLIDSLPDGELRDSAIAILRQQTGAAMRHSGGAPTGAGDPNIVPVADKPENDPSHQTEQHVHVETPEEGVEQGHTIESMPPTVLGFPGLRLPSATPKTSPSGNAKSPTNAARPASAPGSGKQGSDAESESSAPETKPGVSVLGHFPGYRDTARSAGARYFEIPQDQWEKMTPEEQWAANARFLDRMIGRGDEIVLSTPYNSARRGSAFMRELEYLEQRGYRPDADGTRMLPPTPPTRNEP